MLQYDNSGHGIETDEDKLDYTIRLTQFFDHYLKGSPPPAWMTQGRPASLKQIDDRFELDPNGSCSKDCKICKEKEICNTIEQVSWNTCSIIDYPKTEIYVRQPSARL